MEARQHAPPQPRGPARLDGAPTGEGRAARGRCKRPAQCGPGGM